MKDENIRKIMKGNQRNSFVEKNIAIIERPGGKRALVRFSLFAMNGALYSVTSVVMWLKYQNDQML